MASVLALISKAVYEKLPNRELGVAIPLDRYTSKHAAFDKLGPGDSIFLVTVRPKGAVLVAILDKPKRDGDALVGTKNKTGLAFITDQIGQLKLADGKGITAKLDKLGMSLQTPRVLADVDVALLRASAPQSAAPAKAVVQMRVEPKQSATDYPKLKGGKLSARAKQLVAAIYENPDDRSLRGVLADQLLEDQHVWGELISLQLSDPKKHAERIDAIIKQHAREVVGDIANVAARDDLEIVDGFLVSARCAKSKSFTSATERSEAARAPQWATVRTLILTYEMTSVFLAELLRNPASANLRRICYGGGRTTTMASRSSSTAPWEIDPKCEEHRCRMLFDALSDAELGRVVTPKSEVHRKALEGARARRVTTKKSKPKPTKKRSR